jgi:hypothetical protein
VKFIDSKYKTFILTPQLLALILYLPHLVSRDIAANEKQKKV